MVPHGLPGCCLTPTTLGEQYPAECGNSGRQVQRNTQGQPFRRAFIRPVPSHRLERAHVLSRDGSQEAPTQTQSVRTTFLPVVGHWAILATENRLMPWPRREKSGTVLENSGAMGKRECQRAEDAGRGGWVMKRLRPLS